MVRHNNVLPNVHLKKQWQRRVKTWYDQPGRKKRRRLNRERKAKLIAPNPTHKLRPIVRGQTNKYNTKIKLGRGFTEQELKKAGINSINFARSIGISVDQRRKDTSKESQDSNVKRLQDYLHKIILFPKKKAEKKPIVKEATKKQMESAEAKEQNTTKCVIPLPPKDKGYSFEPITKAMKEANVFKVQRTEIKTAKGFYKRLEKIKSKK